MWWVFVRMEVLMCAKMIQKSVEDLAKQGHTESISI
jgi:hypothetical protein